METLVLPDPRTHLIGAEKDAARLRNRALEWLIAIRLPLVCLPLSVCHLFETKTFVAAGAALEYVITCEISPRITAFIILSSLRNGTSARGK